MLASMKNIDAIIDDIIKAEGREYTNHPSDKGGPTKFGVTQQTLSEWRGHPVDADDVALLEELEARRIYEHRYWVKPLFHKVNNHSPAIAIELMDTGVNMGPNVAVSFLQRMLTVFNQRAKAYPDLKVDGLLGNVTLGALIDFLSYRGDEGEEVLLKSLNHLQGARYVELAEVREKNEDFVYGWIKQRS